MAFIDLEIYTIDDDFESHYTCDVEKLCNLVKKDLVNHSPYTILKWFIKSELESNYRTYQRCRTALTEIKDLFPRFSKTRDLIHRMVTVITDQYNSIEHYNHVPNNIEKIVKEFDNEIVKEHIEDDLIYFNDHGILYKYTCNCLEYLTYGIELEFHADYLVPSEELSTCEDCEDRCISEDMTCVISSSGHEIHVCDDCIGDYKYTENYDERVHKDNDSLYYHAGDYYYFPNSSDLFEYMDNNGLIDNGDRELIEDESRRLEDLCPYTIHGYNDIEIPIPFELNPNTVYYGIELEVELGKDSDSSIEDEHVKFVDNYKNTTDDIQFICKEDGSLDDGFEIISIPMTYDDSRDYLDRINTALKPTDIISHGKGTTGFHIHVSSQPLKDVKGFIWTFLNMSMNKHLIQIIGNRQFNSYCSSREFSYDSINHFDDTKEIFDARYNDNRYTVCNVSNSETIELRFFKGSFCKTRMLSYVEFTHSLIEYAKIANNEKKYLSGTRYLQWLSSGRHTYKNLVNYLIAKKQLEDIEQLELNLASV